MNLLNFLLEQFVKKIKFEKIRDFSPPKNSYNQSTKKIWRNLR